jgi:1-acyl-sn-glycerol-3-phosphate acyltransferase
MTDGPAGPPRRGTPRTRAFARGVMRLFGWDIEGELPSAPKFVIAVAPHTSNWDFPIGVLAMLAFGVQMSWLGKDAIFFFPVAPVLRWLGGEPVDRSASHGVVGEAIERFRTREQWVLGIAPEGTRKRTDRWKTGFYRIAAGAGVPVCPAWIDFPRRRLGLGPLVSTTDDEAADLAKLGRFFRKDMARFPDRYVEEGALRAAERQATEETRTIRR